MYTACSLPIKSFTNAAILANENIWRTRQVLHKYGRTNNLHGGGVITLIITLTINAYKNVRSVVVVVTIRYICPVSLVNYYIRGREEIFKNTNLAVGKYYL